MVDELWNSSHESDEDDDSCTLKALCRMNRLALEAPGSVGMAVSISRYDLYKQSIINALLGVMFEFTVLYFNISTVYR